MSIAWPLFGHGDAEASVLAAQTSGKLHHGWLIEGPSGIGKSRLAQRIAAHMLGAQSAPGTLNAQIDDPVVEKLMAGSHPDLRWLCRRPDEKGKLKQDISADAVRDLNHFFSLKAALNGWRVGVIDAIDDLNRFGANAMLKTLEEPPAKCLLIVISHGTRPVLPTIRSRCRALRLTPLDEADTRAALDACDHENARESTVASLARGRPGQGLKLASAEGIAAANAARNFLRGLPKPSDGVLTDVLRRAGADDTAFEAFFNEVSAWLAERSQSEPEFATVWLQTAKLMGDISELNMDRTQASAKLISLLQNPGR